MELLASLLVGKPLNLPAVAGLFLAGYLARGYAILGAGRSPAESLRSACKHRNLRESSYRSLRPLAHGRAALPSRRPDLHLWAMPLINTMGMKAGSEGPVVAPAILERLRHHCRW